MNPIIIDRKSFRDRVYACWLGKNIGGTLGARFEGPQFTHNLTYFDPVPTKSAPNDDLDFQLIWLMMLEDRGVPPRLEHFAEYWLKYLCAYPWNEYGFCMRNLDRGLRPPVSGWFENYYVDNMGSPIRSEIWACIAPANPQKAAALAWMDSAMDHSGGDGMWGEMFWAAVQSAAFVESDPLTLINIGLAMIPPATRLARAVREALWCRRHVSWGFARDKINKLYGGPHACDAPRNAGFTVIGWLYGKDFGDRLCQAVNCGCDTDCTGATLGATLGILEGTKGIPKKWSGPVGTDVIMHSLSGNPDRAPKTLDELTDRTIAVSETMAATTGSGVKFGAKTVRPQNIRSRLRANEEAAAAFMRDVRTAVTMSGDIEITLNYNGEPVLCESQNKRVSVSWDGGAEGTVALKAPKGWKVAKIDGTTFDLFAKKVAARNKLTVELTAGGKKHAAEFTMLGPKEAQGYEGLVDVPHCKKCYGMIGHCLCH